MESADTGDALASRVCVPRRHERGRAVPRQPGRAVDDDGPRDRVRARGRDRARRPGSARVGRAGSGRARLRGRSCSSRSCSSGSSTPRTWPGRSTSGVTAVPCRTGCSSSAWRVLIAAVFLAVRHAANAGPTRCSSRSASIVVLHVVDLVTGAHLEWNTVFGYSPTIGIRFVGEGNITFSQLAAAAVLFAGLLVWQVPTRAGDARRDRRARGDRRRDGRPDLGQRLRRGALRAPGLRAARVDAARAPGACAHRRGASPAIVVAGGRGGRACSTCCGRPTSAPTWASSSRRSAPTSTAPRS